MLRQIERGVQNGPIAKTGVLPVNAFFFWKFCFSLSICYIIENWFDVPSTQMSIIIPFVSAGVSIDGVFSLWVSLKIILLVFFKIWEPFLFLILSFTTGSVIQLNNEWIKLNHLSRKWSTQFLKHIKTCVWKLCLKPVFETCFSKTH